MAHEACVSSMAVLNSKFFKSIYTNNLIFFIQMDSILDLLSDERVFAVELSEPKTELRIKEACDNYF